MDVISYVHKSVELFFHILGLVEVWTRRSMELYSGNVDILYTWTYCIHGPGDGYLPGHRHS
jgi:hypothetical protein